MRTYNNKTRVGDTRKNKLKLPSTGFCGRCHVYAFTLLAKRQPGLQFFRTAAGDNDIRLQRRVRCNVTRKCDRCFVKLRQIYASVIHTNAYNITADAVPCEKVRNKLGSFNTARNDQPPPHPVSCFPSHILPPKCPILCRVRR